MKRFLSLLLLAVALPLFAADVTISSLPAASAIAGTEVAPIVQSATTKKATMAQLATYTRSVTTKADVGLGSVENTALSTWPGTANVTTLGTVGTGTWNATAVAFGKGGTGLTTAADDTVMVSSGAAWVAKTVPDCTDTGGNHLNYTQSTNTISCGTSGSGGTISTGTFLSVASNTVNITTATPDNGQYMRVGGTLTYSFTVSIDAISASTPSAVEFTLPVVTNNFTAGKEAVGTCTTTAQHDMAAIGGISGTQRITMGFIPTVVTALVYSCIVVLKVN